MSLTSKFGGGEHIPPDRCSYNLFGFGGGALLCKLDLANLETVIATLL